MAENGLVPIVTRITEMFGCPHPLQQAGMGGVATPDLATAVARAGGIGMLSGTVGRDGLAGHLDAVPVDAPIGVNFLVPFLDRAALEEAASRSAFVEFFWAMPEVGLVEIAHDGGARVGWQVGSADEARSARDAGCDVIVVQGVEAGGHVRGVVGLLPLLDEVCSVIDLPVIAAGGIGTGRGMAAALAAGADAVRVGTRFIAAQESTAHPVYVNALIGATAADTVLTTAFGDGWPDAPHRVLRSSIEAGERLGSGQSWTPDWPSSTHTGQVEARALYAGQSVGSVRSRQTAAEIVVELVEEAERLLASAGH
jgi:NAD(P)H-dependent flavin oxidoreductase YrpB (nitropropane dioxygenase family)